MLRISEFVFISGASLYSSRGPFPMRDGPNGPAADRLGSLGARSAAVTRAACPRRAAACDVFVARVRRECGARS